MTPKTAILTTGAMVAFAANSLLCRAALESGAIDAASFTAIRVLSGAVVLFLLAWGSGRRPVGWSLSMASMLFLYMIGFSLAYQSLGAATGALLLFGTVQLTMLGWAVRAGERFSARRWLGIALAVFGLVMLLLPGASAPDPLGALFMCAAGVGWGAYSLLGRGSRDPLADTAGNFLLASPMAVLAFVFLPWAGAGDWHFTTSGALLGLASGVVASGLGYVTWYAALRGLAAGQAATVQLSVPVIAALGGAMLLAEPLDTRLMTAGAITLGGVWLALRVRPRAAE